MAEIIIDSNVAFSQSNEKGKSVFRDSSGFIYVVYPSFNDVLIAKSNDGSGNPTSFNAPVSLKAVTGIGSISQGEWTSARMDQNDTLHFMFARRYYTVCTDLTNLGSAFSWFQLDQITNGFVDLFAQMGSGTWFFYDLSVTDDGKVHFFMNEAAGDDLYYRRYDPGVPNWEAAEERLNNNSMTIILIRQIAIGNKVYAYVFDVANKVFYTGTESAAPSYQYFKINGTSVSAPYTVESISLGERPSYADTYLKGTTGVIAMMSDRNNPFPEDDAFVITTLEVDTTTNIASTTVVDVVLDIDGYPSDTNVFLSATDNNFLGSDIEYLLYLENRDFVKVFRSTTGVSETLKTLGVTTLALVGIEAQYGNTGTLVGIGNTISYIFVDYTGSSFELKYDNIDLIPSGPPFLAVVNGDFNKGATWGRNDPGSEGVDFPGAGDQTTIQSSITVDAPLNTLVSCGDLQIDGILNINENAYVLAVGNVTFGTFGQVTFAGSKGALISKNGGVWQIWTNTEKYSQLDPSLLPNPGDDLEFNQGLRFDWDEGGVFNVNKLTVNVSNPKLSLYINNMSTLRCLDDVLLQGEKLIIDANSELDYFQQADFLCPIDNDGWIKADIAGGETTTFLKEASFVEFLNNFKGYQFVGRPGTKLPLRSSLPGTQYLLTSDHVRGTFTFTDCDIQDAKYTSIDQPSEELNVAGQGNVDSGNNTNFDFLGIPLPDVQATLPTIIENDQINNITIVGQNLSQVTTVNLDDGAVTFLTNLNIVNDREITADVPAGVVPGEYNVIATNPAGSNPTSDKKLRITVNQPTVAIDDAKLSTPSAGRGLGKQVDATVLLVYLATDDYFSPTEVVLDEEIGGKRILSVVAMSPVLDIGGVKYLVQPEQPIGTSIYFKLFRLSDGVEFAGAFGNPVTISLKVLIDT